ncbi:MAG: hypothetical protein L6V95_07695 [Candidatus Melainabacteria bacterium]|nr:MAG: hypothetical protein L6V95_07695 [Candidatus Melainabacteria bacterium]
MKLKKFKSEKNYYNMNISFEKMKEILNDNSWYDLQIPASDLEFTDFSKVIKYQDIITRLMKSIVKNFFNYKKKCLGSSIS